VRLGTIVAIGATALGAVSSDLLGSTSHALAQSASHETAPKRPNIVFMMMDNMGYGEPGCYGGGILRGAPTPRIDELARQGTRLTNFNVETECTPTRSAIMTGRYPIRSGTWAVTAGGLPDGLVKWEVTIAQLLSERGYATGAWGKWHLGSAEERLPHHKGFDEWYGIPRTYDESVWSATGTDASGIYSPSVGPNQGWNEKIEPPEFIYEARKGEKAKPVAALDVEHRRNMDAEITRRAVDFIKGSAKAGKPFYAYVPFALFHYPTQPSPEFTGKTGNGSFADCIAEMDYRVGQVLDAIKESGVEDDTLVIFTSDNGPETMPLCPGSPGPWRGTIKTALEGSLRVPFIIRWPGKVPADRVSNEIVHATDCFTTLARIGGAEIPRDRAIDGIDQTEFFLGKSEKSAREGFLVFVDNEIYAAKWKNWKAHFFWRETMFDPTVKLPYPRLFNLIADLREEHDIAFENTWAIAPIGKMIVALERSLKEYPPIPRGAPDPYVPPRRPGS
jgi:arylsulfatase